MNPTINRFFALASCIVLFASCAQIVAPTGGEKDTTPPNVLKELPEGSQTNFKSKKITLSFDEYVTLSNIEEQLVISPPLEEKPEFEISGKSIIIHLRKEPKPNTTYTINFGNSIVDIHEANVLGDYRYVFATGDIIDSMVVAGKVVSGETNTPEKNFSICLYPVDTFSDSTIYKNKPSYFGKTKEDGSFILKNIPSTRFYLAAFNDENKNLKYDQNESMAFLEKPINTADSNSSEISLFSFKPNAYEPNRIVDTFCTQSGKFTFLIYKPNQVNIKPSDDSISFFTQLKKGINDMDSFFVFTTEKHDSIVFNDSKKSFLVKGKKGIKNAPFAGVLKKTMELNDSIAISFSTPILSYDTSKIIFKHDSVIIPIDSGSVHLSHFSFKLTHNWTEGMTYSFEIKDSAFKDIYGQYSKKDKLTWASKTLKNYSILKLIFKYTKPDKNLLVHITDPAEKVIYYSFYIDKKTEYLFEYLIPGSYKIKVIDDRNQNGKWDNGDYLNKIQPEKVYYYPEQFSLRAYWDLEQTIEIDQFVK